MRKTDIVSGLVLLLLGLFTMFVVIPDQIGSRAVDGLPPDFFPRLLVWLFIMLSALLVGVRAVAHLRAAPSLEKHEVLFGAREALFISGMAIVLFAIHWVMSHMGFIAAGALAIVVMATLMGSLRKHPFRVAAMTVIVPFAVDYVFRQLFFIYLPG